MICNSSIKLNMICEKQAIITMSLKLNSLNNNEMVHYFFFKQYVHKKDHEITQLTTHL